jgi:hypothetical protein
MAGAGADATRQGHAVRAFRGSRAVRVEHDQLWRGLGRSGALDLTKSFLVRQRPLDLRWRRRDSGRMPVARISLFHVKKGSEAMVVVI